MYKTKALQRLIKKSMQQYERYATSATIYSIDGQRADIRLGSSSTLLHHIEIVGDPSL